ncbi:MAG: EF-Tu/IF-2/RF-3 family GTPase [Ilumatobacteraceae bacterium]
MCSRSRGRGTVVTGKVEQGKVHTGDEIEIVGLRATQKTQYGSVDVPQVAR